MNTSIKSITSIIIASALTAITSISHAALVQGTIKGVIAEHAETSGEGASVFGLDGNALMGQAFTVHFRYQPNSAPLAHFVEDESSSRAIYQSSDPSQDWLGLSITINDHTHVLEGNYRRADIRDAWSAHPFNKDNPNENDWIHLAVDGGSGPFDGSHFRREFLDIAVYLSNEVIKSSGLPETIHSHEITRVYNSAAFRINDFDVAAETGEITYERYVSFNLDVHSIETTAVPIPGAAWLLGSGLVALITVTRRKHQANKFSLI
ncbi:MAG TPA: VPLPA-CTERM sorting domain-containing protein [Gammaproteobacteria bacterium]|nr:VPLPA-CTERM sorting domain-containing protein [Gammaproteobacteria bacterium]